MAAGIKERVLQLYAERPNLSNDEIAEIIRKEFRGANTTAASVSSIKSVARRTGAIEKAELTVMADVLDDEDEDLPDDSGEAEEVIYARIAKRFAAMDRMANAVMRTGVSEKARVPAMIVSGPAGLGKSFGVKRAIDLRRAQAEEEGEEFKCDYISGTISPAGLYIAAWNSREEGSVIILDDCDTVFQDEDSLNILKSMLDSQDKRMLSWRKRSNWLKEMDIDDNFEFKGSVIFLTNLDFERKIESGKAYAVHFKALMDRCLYLHLTIRTIKDFMVRIKQVVYEEKMLEKYGIDKKAIDDIMDYVNQNRRRFYHLSLRLVHQIALCQLADSENWKADIEMTKMRAYTEDLVLGNGSNKADRELAQ